MNSSVPNDGLTKLLNKIAELAWLRSKSTEPNRPPGLSMLVEKKKREVLALQLAIK